MNSPIIMTGESVRGILAGRKTLTRIPIEPQPQWDEEVKSTRIHGPLAFPIGALGQQCGFPIFVDGRKDAVTGFVNRHGPIGSKLWVRETWANFGGDEDLYLRHRPGVGYKATWDSDKFLWPDFAHHVTYIPGDKWRSACSMPEWAARIRLEITVLKVERLQAITAAEVLATGFEPELALGLGLDVDIDLDGNFSPYGELKCLLAYHSQWDSINRTVGKLKWTWESNPWVLSIFFRRVEP
jgi:hypothetical protein